MKEAYEKCVQPCAKLDKDRKNHCLNTCDQQSRMYSNKYNSEHGGAPPPAFTELFGISYKDFTAENKVLNN